MHNAAGVRRSSKTRRKLSRFGCIGRVNSPFFRSGYIGAQRTAKSAVRVPETSPVTGLMNGTIRFRLGEEELLTDHPRLRRRILGAMFKSEIQSRYPLADESISRSCSVQDTEVAEPARPKNSLTDAEVIRLLMSGKVWLEMLKQWLSRH